MQAVGRARVSLVAYLRYRRTRWQIVPPHISEGQLGLAELLCAWRVGELFAEPFLEVVAWREPATPEDRAVQTAYPHLARRAEEARVVGRARVVGGEILCSPAAS